MLRSKIKWYRKPCSSCLLIFIFVFYSSFPSRAQDSLPVIRNREAMEKIQSARIGLITQRLNLTPEQAQKFWPVYNEYIQKKHELRQEIVASRQDVDRKNLSDEESRKVMDRSMDIKQKMLDLEKEYSIRLQQVITPQQILELYKAEEDFRRMILQRLKERREHAGGRTPGMR